VSVFFQSLKAETMGLEKAETTAELGMVLGILLLLAYAYSKFKNPVSNAATAVKDFFVQDSGATITGTAPWVGSIAQPATKPLTPLQADSIAKFIGLAEHGGGYNVSPDKTQVWFFDGSFFDNTTGHYFNSSGVDQGDLLGGGGTQPARSSGGQVTDSVDDSAATLDLTAPLAG
jgi:hypothetical protein